jgi:hypothetical protein
VQVVVIEHVRSYGQASGGGQWPGDRKQLVLARGHCHGDRVDERTTGELEILIARLERARPPGKRMRDRVHQPIIPLDVTVPFHVAIPFHVAPDTFH